MIAETDSATKLEQALVVGDLSTLSERERVLYYQRVCDSLSINPLTKPFAYLRLRQGGPLVLYATRDCTDQLRSSRGVSITRLERERQDDVYCVTAYATSKDGRTDSSIGAVAIGNKRGDDLANALMKAETKAKRRVTLSICGLGMLDETEVETVPGAIHEPGETATPSPAPLPLEERTQRWIDDGPSDYRPLTEDQVQVVFDRIQEETGSKPSEVSLVLGTTLVRFLAAQRRTGAQLVRDWRAYKRQGVPIPGAPPALERDAATGDE